MTWHNLHYYQELMEDMRQAISTESFAQFQAKFHQEQAQGDIDPL